MLLLYSPPAQQSANFKMIAGRHTHRDQHRTRAEASGGSSITPRETRGGGFVVIDSFALSNRGLLASAKTQVRRVAAVLSAAAGALLLISTPVSAQVASRVVGPTDPATGFPVGLIDERGTSLAPCVDNILLCLAGSTLPNLALPPAVPGNFPSEFFYSLADANLNVPGSTVALLRVGIEGSLVNAPLVEAAQQTLVRGE